MILDYTRHHRRLLPGGVLEYLVDGVPHRFSVDAAGRLRRRIGDGRGALVPTVEAAALHAGGILAGLDYRPQSTLAHRVAHAIERQLDAGATIWSIAAKADVDRKAIRRVLAGQELRTDTAERILLACGETV